ncbi:MAG: phosphomethylpyrimidine synthase ThiC [Gammaproteobacteria bacterium]|nr:phosphomethylpyrimidine synthase ThiC [Gammaproteobacteria bacterium]
MKTQIELSRAGKISRLVSKIAKQEKIPAKTLAKLVACGQVVIPTNVRRNVEKPCGIGKMLSVKVNANIGTSTEKPSVVDELNKLKMAMRFGADTVMDLSIGGDLKKIRNLILQKSIIPVGTVPIYEAAINAEKRYGNFLKMNRDDILDVISEQAEDGVDFFTLHSGITRKNLNLLAKSKRKLGIVSRGGAILANWMRKNKKENPLYELFDEILKIIKRFDITISLGDGLRPGSVLDATDRPQLSELKLLGHLARRAKKNGVQVMIEGPGHIPINQIKQNVTLEKKYCNGAPFYVLGPLVTDIGVGFDHIVAAIGSSLAAFNGADFLCFVTPAEHLKLPNAEDIKLGIIASRIAAHSADLARGLKSAWQKDKLMSEARKKRNWDKQIQLSLDPLTIKRIRKKTIPKINDVCTMCGRYCSIKLMQKCLKRA